jgi:phospholipid-binding lipoprotein MlaA
MKTVSSSAALTPKRLTLALTLLTFTIAIAPWSAPLASQNFSESAVKARLASTSASIAPAPAQHTTAAPVRSVASAASSDIYDPLEPMNRGIYRFNTVLDTILLKPVARIYRTALPVWGRDRVTSFLKNLGEPITWLNSVLQGDSTNAFHAFWRFTINSTFGIAGIFDIAQQAGLTETKEDFGQTLGRYGVGSGPYLILPIIGPSSGRDAVGRVADIFSDPFNYILSDDALYVRYGVDLINSRSEALPFTDKIEKTSLDPYATIRSLYLQSRYDDVHNGTISTIYPN